MLLGCYLIVLVLLCLGMCGLICCFVSLLLDCLCGSLVLMLLGYCCLLGCLLWFVVLWTELLRLIVWIREAGYCFAIGFVGLLVIDWLLGGFNCACGGLCLTGGGLVACTWCWVCCLLWFAVVVGICGWIVCLLCRLLNSVG